MTPATHHGQLVSQRRPALTLLEAVVSIAIVGVMLVAALNTLGAAKSGMQKVDDRRRAALLAQQLMSEILAQAYKEPVDAALFGLEAGEAATSRANYDDVDDYHGWAASPPQYKDGTVMPDLTGWKCTVTVEYVNPADPNTTSLADLGAKRVTITVTRNDLPIASQVGIRTAAGT